MVNSKLSKLYLVTPDSFNKIKESSEKKKRIIHKEKNIDYLHRLKNLERKKLKNALLPKVKNRENTTQNMEKLLAELGSQLKTNHTNLNDFGTQTNHKNLIDFGTQTNQKKNLNDFGTQTKRQSLDDEIKELLRAESDEFAENEGNEENEQESTHQFYDANDSIENLAANFNKSLSFRQPITEYNEDDDDDNEDDDLNKAMLLSDIDEELNEINVNELDAVTTPVRTPMRAPLRKPRKLELNTPVATPPKTLQKLEWVSSPGISRKSPIRTRRRAKLDVVEGMDISPALTPAQSVRSSIKKAKKHYATPLVGNVMKRRILSRTKKLSNSILKRAPILDEETTREVAKRIKSIEEMRKALIRGERKAKQKAYEKMKALKSWKRI